MNNSPTNLNIESKLFWPRRCCPYYQSLDNNISKDGVYTTKNDGVVRQMFNCGKGKHRFSETGYCDLFGKHGNFKEYEQMSKLSCYGLSVDAIADVLLKDTRTIATWQRCVSKKANLFHDVICLSITLTVLIQMEELWSFLRNKNPIQNIQIYSSGYDYPTLSRSTEFIVATSGFAVTPRLVGQQALLDVSPWTDRASARDQFDTQKVPSSFRINLGEWVELGGIDETGQHST